MVIYQWNYWYILIELISILLKVDEYNKLG